MPCQAVALCGCTVCSIPQPHQHHMLSGLMSWCHETGSYCACPRLPVNLSILFWPRVYSHMLYSLFFLDVYFIFLLICRLDISVCVHVCAFPYSSWMQSWLCMLLFKDMSLFTLVSLSEYSFLLLMLYLLVLCYYCFLQCLYLFYLHAVFWILFC